MGLIWARHVVLLHLVGSAPRLWSRGLRHGVQGTCAFGPCSPSPQSTSRSEVFAGSHRLDLHEGESTTTWSWWSSIRPLSLRRWALVAVRLSPLVLRMRGCEGSSASWPTLFVWETRCLWLRLGPAFIDRLNLIPCEVTWWLVRGLIWPLPQ